MSCVTSVLPPSTVLILGVRRDLECTAFIFVAMNRNCFSSMFLGPKVLNLRKCGVTSQKKNWKEKTVQQLRKSKQARRMLGAANNGAIDGLVL